MELNFESVIGEHYLEENIRNCADCDEENVTWCDLKYGCFLCIECAIIHKQLRVGAESQVKSFHLDNWTEDELSRATGNYEADDLDQCRPDFYYKPGPHSLYVLKFEYIQDKYKRHLFDGQGKKEWHCGFKGNKIGVLFKKGKSNECWKPRYFQLKDHALEYYCKREDEKAKCNLHLSTVDIALQPVPGKPYAVAISHLLQDELTRTYYVHGETNRETIEWYYSILAAQYCLSKDMSNNNTLGRGTLGREHSKFGYMYKTGSKRKDKWRKRWVKIINSKVQYFEDETSPHPKGEFDLEATDSFAIEDGQTGHKVTPPTRFTFTIKTPYRDYKFCAPDEEEKDEWLQFFERAINA